MVAADRQGRDVGQQHEYRHHLNLAACRRFQQDWDDQIVLALGLSYKFNDAFTGRVGYNYGKNPIPDEFVNYLWPAIVEGHYTVGFGYAINKQSEVNFGLSYVPEVSVTGTGPPADGQRRHADRAQPAELAADVQLQVLKWGGWNEKGRRHCLRPFALRFRPAEGFGQRHDQYAHGDDDQDGERTGVITSQHCIRVWVRK